MFVGAVLAQAVMDVATLRGQQAARAEAGGATASGASSGQLAALEAKVAGLPTGPALKQAMQDALAEALPPQLAALQAAAAARQLLALQAAAALQLAALHASVDGLEAGEEAACALREAQVKNLQAMLVAEVTEAALKAKPKPSPQQLAALQAKLGSKQVQKALHGIIDMSKTDMEEAVTELVAEAWEEVEQVRSSAGRRTAGCTHA